MSKEQKKIVAKKKINRYTVADCEKELARLAETKSDTSTYAEHVRRKLTELK
jgi:hypothetical protein